MKILAFILAMGIVAGACTKKANQMPYQRTGEVVCTGHDDRTIHLHVKALGSDVQDAAYYSDVSAFENLLYKGIPDSSQELPLIESDRATQDLKEYFAMFFERGEYLKFVTNQQVIANTRSGDYNFVEKNISIDLFAFRRFLEEERIIKKFGIE